MSFPHEVSSLMESGDESVTVAVTPPSIRKAAFTRAAGAVIGAAVLVAGGYALGRSAGISTHSKAFTFLKKDHEFKHMSKKCVGALHELEDNAEETGRKHEAGGHAIECQEEEMVCKATVHAGEMDHPMSKCFPAHKCKVKNIRKELEAQLEEAGAEVSMSYFECGDDVPEAEGEPEDGPGAPEAEGEPEGPEAPEAEGEPEGPEAPEAEGEPEGQ